MRELEYYEYEKSLMKKIFKWEQSIKMDERKGLVCCNIAFNDIYHSYVCNYTIINNKFKNDSFYVVGNVENISSFDMFYNNIIYTLYKNSLTLIQRLRLRLFKKG